MTRHLLRSGGWGALLFLLIALVFAGLGLRERGLARALDDHGTAVEATIEGLRTERHTRRTKNGTRTETDHLATYAFEAPTEPGGPPRAQRVTRDVPGWVYDDLRLGQTVTVRYLPERPDRIDYFSGESRENVLFMAILASVFALIAGILGGVAVHLGRRAHRIDVHGVTTQGRVQGVHPRKVGHSLQVGYTDAAGTLRSATLPLGRHHPLAGAAEGSAVTLRYDPQDPFRVALADPGTATAPRPAAATPAIQTP